MFSASAHGSSPHTWGIRRICPFAASRLRFIPTYVGHTFCVPFPQIWKTVHPHIRGAYFQGAVGQLHALGSSPHTWGIPLDLTRQQFSGRFIPTYVGHTKFLTVLSAQFAVHPHIRGAYCCIFKSEIITDGSSPHTWGIRMRPVGSVPAPPVHPHIRGAYVCGRSGRFPPRPVHPHIRGAYCYGRCSVSEVSGSSPHTWGIL